MDQRRSLKENLKGTLKLIKIKIQHIKIHGAQLKPGSEGNL